MKNIRVEDIKKTGESKPVPAVKEVVEKKLTDTDIFLEECDEDDAKLFHEIKNVLMEKREQREHEAVSKDMFEGYRTMIKHIKYNDIAIEDDGIVINLRKPLLNKESVELTQSIKVLFDRNEGLEKAYRKTVKTNEKSPDYNEDMGIALIASTLANAGNVKLGPESLRRLKNTNENDYQIVLEVYKFFRS